MNRPLIIAHRGFSSNAPENTLIAFETAINEGVDFIEFDVQLTNDRIPVILHDATVDRTARGAHQGRIADLTLQEAKSLDACSWFYGYSCCRIPTLQEVIELPLKNTKLFIEIKGEYSQPQEVVKAIVDVVPTNMLNDCIFGSFNFEIIELMQEALPDQKLLGLAENERDINLFLDIGIELLGLGKKVCSQAILSELAENNIDTWVYTVNDTQLAVSLVEQGVKGLITDNPALIKKVFSR